MDVGQTHADAILRDIIQAHGKLSVPAASVRPEDDLYQLGLSSLATVNLMLAVEERFGIVIPDEALTRETFQSVAALLALVHGLSGEDGA